MEVRRPRGRMVAAERSPGDLFAVGRRRTTHRGTSLAGTSFLSAWFVLDTLGTAGARGVSPEAGA